MKNLVDFNKNASVLAMLLGCLFFNPGVGKAQWSYINALRDTITVTVSNQGGPCGERAVRYLDTGDNPTYNPSFDLSLVAQFQPNKRFIVEPGIEYVVTVKLKRKSGTQHVFGSPIVPDTYWHQSSGLNPLNVTKIDDIDLPSNFTTKEVKVKFKKSDVLGVLSSRPYTVKESVTGPELDRFVLLIPFVIQGPVNPGASVPVLGTTLQPQIPYMVLHAPPGDGSSSEFQKTKTTCREFVNTYAEDGSNSANLDVKVGIAGSAGFIITTDFEFSVTFSAGVTSGDLAITTKSNQTCVTTSSGFSTEALLGNGGGDVFIGYGTNLNYGVYPAVTIDPNTCLSSVKDLLIYVPTGNPRKFVYTEEAIQSDIINQKALAANTALSARARNEAQNQADVWEKVLAQNNVNKNNPKNAVIENLTFNAGANSSGESSITVLETNSLEVEHYIEFNTGISAVVEVGGSGVSGGWEYRGSYRYGKTNTSSAEVANVVRYTLVDNSDGDEFKVKMVRDPMYGTPVFRVEPTSKSSCPYQGGYQRDQPKLKHDGATKDRITSQGNPVGSSATFKVDICNESNEARTYNLKLNAQSNLNGAVVSAAGVPLNGNDLGQSFSVPANSCVQDLVVEVKQLSANSPLTYPDLELFLYAPCEEDIQSSVFASVFFGNTTSVDDLADNRLLSVSPNPTSGWLKISLPAGNTLEAVRIVDLSGKTVHNLELDAAVPNKELDLSGLPKGIYALQARADGRVFVKKVVVN